MHFLAQWEPWHGLGHCAPGPKLFQHIVDYADGWLALHLTPAEYEKKWQRRLKGSRARPALRPAGPNVEPGRTALSWRPAFSF